MDALTKMMPPSVALPGPIYVMPDSGLDLRTGLVVVNNRGNLPIMVWMLYPTSAKSLANPRSLAHGRRQPVAGFRMVLLAADARWPRLNGLLCLVLALERSVRGRSTSPVPRRPARWLR